MRSGRAVLLILALLLPGAGLAAPAVSPASDPPALGVFIPAAPQPAPKISFSNAAGQKFKLADFAGRVVIVNLWATWCAPCRREMPSLERLQARLGDKITILAISEDTRGEKAVAPFVAKLGLKAIKTYLDPTSAVGQAFKVDGLPSSFVLDRNGRVVGRVVGEAKWDSPKMLAVIDPLLGEGEVVKTSFPPKHP
ncbi:MAG TPA: TlpA disulfide reductase family protein [Stellaceae bacterium]|jgi:thiol-disulfide isomerase/thioredoxin